MTVTTSVDIANIAPTPPELPTTSIETAMATWTTMMATWTCQHDEGSQQ